LFPLFFEAFPFFKKLLKLYLVGAFPLFSFLKKNLVPFLKNLSPHSKIINLLPETKHHEVSKKWGLEKIRKTFFRILRVLIAEFLGKN